jgi:hypothetical protein
MEEERDESSLGSYFSEFVETPSKEVFRARHHRTLKSSLEAFLKCRVSIVYSPIDWYRKKYGVDILDNPHQAIFPVSDERVLLSVHPLYKPEHHASFGLTLSNPQIAMPSRRLLQSITRILTMRLHVAGRSGFNINLQFFGNYMILDIIVHYLARGGYDRDNLKFVFEIFANLRTLTFEDQVFETGLILTRSHRAFQLETRAGSLIALKNSFWLQPDMLENKRFWYLVDGSSCFYICDAKLQVHRIFFLDQGLCTGSATSTFFLKNALDDRDIAFRTVGGKEMVAVSATGEEFTFTGTQWHFRDYNLIRNALKVLLPDFGPEGADAMMELVLHLTVSRKSALLWVPERQEDIHSLTVHAMEFWSKSEKNTVNLGDRRHMGLIQRLASSDGALVFSRNGMVYRFAAVANLSNADPEDFSLTGSGSLAAQFLSQSGMTIKVSQDGTASIYTGGQFNWSL